MNIRDRYDPVGRDEGMGAFDNHIPCRVDEDQRGVVGVGLHQPYDNGDVVGDSLVRHRDGAVGLEEIDGAAVVVGEYGGLRLKRRIGFDKLQ